MATFFKLTSSHYSKTLWRATLISVPVIATGVGAKVYMEASSPPIQKKTDENNVEKHHRIVILGGGTAGIGVAAQLRHKGERDICIVEPKTVHYYQPMWTLVGGGIKQNVQSSKPMDQVVPRSVKLYQDAAETIDADSNTVQTANGKKLHYDYLVVATGMEHSFDHVDGLQETIGKNGVVSIYDYHLCQKTQEAIANTKQGHLIFTQHADSPIKCGGAPQKIMWLTDDRARREGYRDQVHIHWALPQPTMFPVKKYGDILGKLAEERNILRHHGMRLAKVDGDKKQATFVDVADSKKKLILDFALLHVVPFMKPPKAVTQSKLANPAGFVDVDAKTLQHKTYPNVFCAGDSSALPTSKTMAAIAKQVPVLVHNLRRFDQNKSLNAEYDGYTSCPITTARNKLLLAEFKYDGELAETFPWFQSQPRGVFMFFKETLFPIAYFHFFLAGNWYGPSTIFPPSFPEKKSP